MMNILIRQRGMSMGQIMGLLVIIGFASTMAASMVPAYLDNSTVSSALEEVQVFFANKDVDEIDNAKVIQKLNGYFQVNMVSNEIMEAVKVVRENKKVMLTVNYEIRKPVSGNVDIVMKFVNEVELGR